MGVSGLQDPPDGAVLDPDSGSDPVNGGSPQPLPWATRIAVTVSTGWRVTLAVTIERFGSSRTAIEWSRHALRQPAVVTDRHRDSTACADCLENTL